MFLYDKPEYNFRFLLNQDLLDTKFSSLITNEHAKSCDIMDLRPIESRINKRTASNVLRPQMLISIDL